jgi:DNA polymerase-3 subunit gamma/tau
MPYQSLYRTWRPKRFTEMVGQEAIVKSLKNQVSSGRIAHAYLFCGSRGTGKTSAARIMAMAINCLRPQDGNPCLECANCQALMSENTLDVYEMDAASNSRVEEIRELLSKSDYPPQFVKFKVYIIDEVHMLSNAAFNALLKTLEEPPEYMVFILATTEPQKLPPTILSRCQRFDFGRITENDMVSRLKMALTEGMTAEEEALHMIAASAEGSMRDAWSLMDMCLGGEKSLNAENVRLSLGIVSQSFLSEYLSALGEADAGLALKKTEQLMMGGRDAQVFLRDLSAHLRQVLAVAWTGSGIRDITGDQLERLKQQAERIGPDLLLDILSKCMQAETDARWAASPRAVLDLFVLRVCQLRREKDSSALLARLSGIEQQLRCVSFPTARTELKDNPSVDSPQTEEPLGEKSRKAEPQTVAKTEPVQPAIAPIEIPLPLQAAGPMDSDLVHRSQNPKDAWNGMLAKLGKINSGLYAMVHRGRYGGYSDNAFTLELGKEDEILSYLLNEEARAGQIANLLSEEMGHPVKFSAGGSQRVERAVPDPMQDENIDALAEVFGRDKIIVKKE